MIVTKIQSLDKKRSRVWLDEEFAFVFYKGELRRFKVEEGAELSEAQYKEIMTEVLPKRAKLRAMNLLKSHTYSVNQLRDKLKEGYYPEDIIQIALDYVASYGYTDDLRLSEEYIRIHLDTKSRQRIIQDLQRKGIDKETISKAFISCEDEGFEQDELSQIKALLVKRGYDRNKGPEDYADYESYKKDWAKQYGFLIRKGYSSSAIRSAMGGEEDY